MLNFLCFIILGLSCVSSYASEIYLDSEGNHHLFEIENENNPLKLRHFLVKPNQLPDVQKTLYFPNLKKRDHYLSSFIKLRSKNLKKYVTTENPNLKLWQVENEWNSEWEIKYGEWVEKTLYKDFFVDHQIETDCVDVAYALRWIFSRIHKLPMVSTLAGSLTLFSHESIKKEWANLPTHENWNEDQRFRAALKYLLETVYTKTLPYDVYPIKIQSSSFHAGVIHFLGGHTEVVSKILEDGGLPIELMNSTVPRAIRSLAVSSFTRSTPTPRGNFNTGFVQFKWPILKNGKWILKNETDMPDYSLEQFDPTFYEHEGNFALAILNRLGIKFEIDESLNNIVSDLKNAFIERLNIVKSGNEFCKNNNCEIDSIGFDEWSTPSRDKRIVEQIQHAKEMVSNFNRFGGLALKLYESKLKKTMLNIENKNINLIELSENFSHLLYSSDPRNSIEERWFLNEKVIKNHIEKRIRELFNRRFELNKMEFQELKDYESSFEYYCQIKPCSESLTDDVQEMIKEIPTLSLNHKLKVIPNFKVVNILNNNEILIDNKKIFNLQTMSFIKLPIEATRFWSLDEDSLIIANKENIYLRKDGIWSLLYKLKENDEDEIDKYLRFVSFLGDHVVLGISFDDDDPDSILINLNDFTQIKVLPGSYTVDSTQDLLHFSALGNRQNIELFYRLKDKYVEKLISLPQGGEYDCWYEDITFISNNYFSLASFDCEAGQFLIYMNHQTGLVKSQVFHTPVLLLNEWENNSVITFLGKDGFYHSQVFDPEFNLILEINKIRNRPEIDFDLKNMLFKNSNFLLNKNDDGIIQKYEVLPDSKYIGENAEIFLLKLNNGRYYSLNKKTEEIINYPTNFTEILFLQDWNLRLIIENNKLTSETLLDKNGQTVLTNFQGFRLSLINIPFIHQSHINSIFHHGNGLFFPLSAIRYVYILK
jgi:hypothetical protein